MGVNAYSRGTHLMISSEIWPDWLWLLLSWYCCERLSTTPVIPPAISCGKHCFIRPSRAPSGKGNMSSLGWHVYGIIESFLVADMRLYTLPCRSVGLSVRYISSDGVVLSIHSLVLITSCITVPPNPVPCLVYPCLNNAPLSHAIWRKYLIMPPVSIVVTTGVCTGYSVWVLLIWRCKEGKKRGKRGEKKREKLWKLSRTAFIRRGRNVADDKTKFQVNVMTRHK